MNDDDDSIVDYAQSSFQGHVPIPHNDQKDVELWNARILNVTLQNLQPGQTLFIENTTYHIMGGLYAAHLENVTIRHEGILKFTSRHLSQWPRTFGNKIMECFQLHQPTNVTWTGGGILDGSGAAWWGLPFVGYLVREEHRPRLLRISQGRNVVVEQLLLVNSPYWTTLFDNVDGLVVRYVGIQARRTSSTQTHSLLDLTAFNTDGLDISGRNVHVHDCDIWVQDDIVAVKDASVVSENMLFERIRGSGLGLTIGSIGGVSSHVRNITLRDCTVINSVKGLYLKFRQTENASIRDVTFENILLQNPSQFAIWMGPAQQSDSKSLCHANPCSLCWPWIPGTVCHGERNGTYENIVFHNITIVQDNDSSSSSSSVLMGSLDNPMRGVVFDGVRTIVQPQSTEWEYDQVFPLLRRVSHITTDRYVLVFEFLLALGFVLLLGGMGYSYWKLVHSRWKSMTWYGITTLLTLVVVLRYVVVSHRLVESSYFVCEGIQDGVARGDTFPVPPCLRDETTTTTTTIVPTEETAPISLWTHSILASLTVVVVCSLVPLLTLWMQWHNPSFVQPQDYASVPNENDDDEEDSRRRRRTIELSCTTTREIT